MGLRDWLSSDSDSDSRANENRDSGSGYAVKRESEQQSKSVAEISNETQKITPNGDGDFPWLEYPDHGWEVPCPACSETVTNEFAAFHSHWKHSSGCPGPSTVDNATWDRLGVDTDKLDTSKTPETSGGTGHRPAQTDPQDESTFSDREPAGCIAEEHSFPFLGDNRERTSTQCPECGQSVDNTPHSFLSHWSENEQCSGPPTTAPSETDFSHTEWQRIIQPITDGEKVRKQIDAGSTDQSVVDAKKQSNSGSDDTHAEQTVRVQNELDEIDAKLAEVQSARKKRDYLRALEICREAISSANDTKEAAINELPGRVSDAESRVERATDLEDELTAEQETYETLRNSIESCESWLNSVGEPHGIDDHEAILQQIEDLTGTLEDAATQAQQYELGSISERISRLQERYGTLQRRVKSELVKQRKVPESVSSPPRASLEYDDIETDKAIGSGGSADVFYATIPADEDAEIALKKPSLGGTLHAESVERLLEEAKTWQQLDDHDHIVSVIDYGAEPLPWIAMEYMDAGHLGERIDEMGMAQKLWTAVSITDGVYHAHRHGVAHRDLKPENILLRSVTNAWDVPKVADWGLSKHLLEHSRSRDGLTVEYAAPEQFSQSASSDDLTDIYQLGAVFYELFTGRPPFEGEMFAVMKQIETESPTPPSDIADVPDGLDEILMTALAKEKADRYETVINLRNDLTHLSNQL